MPLWVQKDLTPVITNYLVSYVEKEPEAPWLGLHPRTKRLKETSVLAEFPNEKLEFIAKILDEYCEFRSPRNT